MLKLFFILKQNNYNFLSYNNPFSLVTVRGFNMNLKIILLTITLSISCTKENSLYLEPNNTMLPHDATKVILQGLIIIMYVQCQ